MRAKLFAATIAAGVGAFGWGQSAAAAVIGYTLDINNPVFNTANRVNNVPDFRLTNTSDTASITAFSLTIGDNNFHYDFVRSQSAFNDTGATLSFTLNDPDFINDHVGDGLIDYIFSGFDPGDAFQFEADVDPHVGNVVQDYRNILFPNAVVTVSFSDGNSLSQSLAPADIGLAGYRFGQTFAASQAPQPQANLPEPCTLALFGLGLAGLGLAARRKRS